MVNKFAKALYELIDAMIIEGTASNKVILKLYEFLLYEMMDGVAAQRIGQYYLTGQLDGIKQNGIEPQRWKVRRNKAEFYLRTAYRLGCREAAYDLAWVYLDRRKTASLQDYRSVKWFKIAMRFEKGPRKWDCYQHIGCYYYRKIKGVAGTKKALEYWRVAARNGDVASMIEMGIAFWFGDGVDQNSIIARKYFAKCIRKDPSTVKRIKRVMCSTAPEGEVNRWIGSL
ncbi:MAG: sel1 repeat family protein [Kiritimatiellae bacterium]|nr:sel1 repeat family protein [Kiritimatiellia bacterium]